MRITLHIKENIIVFYIVSSTSTRGGNKMSYDPGYTKANVTYESNEVLKVLAAEKTKKIGKRMYVYNVIDEILRREYPEYFRKVTC
jgi:hypothetical protein